MRNKNKIGEHWLPRITEKLIIIGSQFDKYLLLV